MIGDDPGWSESVAQYWDSVPGARHAGVQIAPFGTVDWAPYIAKLRASGAKAVLVAISWGVQYAAFLQQANAAGLYKQMQIVAPVGFPENSMVPGYGTAASNSTVQALLATKVLSQYGGSWTYVDQTPTGKRFNQVFYKAYGYPPTTQANVAMADTWMLLSAIKAGGHRSAYADAGADHAELPDSVLDTAAERAGGRAAAERARRSRPSSRSWPSRSTASATRTRCCS